MRVLDVYADVLCPFTHAGLCRIVIEREARGVALLLRARAWPLEWVNGAPIDAGLVAEEIRALRASVAPTLFTGFDPGAFPSTSVRALALAAAAYARDLASGEAVSLALRDAVFERGLDVGRADVLARIGVEHGLEVPADDRAVRAEYETGKALGVVGSPYFVLDDHRWFCPALDIRHSDGEFHIRMDRVAGEEFDRQIFG